jgi:prepilin-type processing-associated H-X9-DG protein
MNVVIKIAGKQVSQTSGYTRTDIVFVTGTLFLVAILAWATVWATGEKRRIFVCAHHLKTLSRAFDDYAHDHTDTLPPAVFDDGTTNTSWDREISVYLEPVSTGQNSPDSQKMWEAKVAPIFKCPSDHELRGGAEPRSYSMPMYDIKQAGWPPTSDSLGGLGLYLDIKAIEKARAADLNDSPDYRPAIKTSIVTAPSDTALLVERISILNALWATKFACITSTKQQFDAKTFAAKDFHGGKMNYLLLDGHVELLWPIQSGGHIGSGDQGLWTIRPGD